MKKLFVLTLFMSLSLIGKSIFAEDSLPPFWEFSMRMNDLGCNGNQRCYSLTATSGADGPYIAILLNGNIVASAQCELVRTTVCLNTQDSPYDVTFSCANELREDGCIVTIDPC